MLGYYAHSHGNGHCNYAALLSNQLANKLVVFTSKDYSFDPTVQYYKLPDEDRDGSELQFDSGQQPSFLHHNPVGLKKIQQRSCLLLSNRDKRSSFNFVILSIFFSYK